MCLSKLRYSSNAAITCEPELKVSDRVLDAPACALLRTLHHCTKMVYFWNLAAANYNHPASLHSHVSIVCHANDTPVALCLFALNLCRRRYAFWNARHMEGLFALVAHATSLDIGLPTSPPDSRPCASEAAQVEDPEPSEAALARLESLVAGAPLWPAAINLWKRFSTSQAQPVAAAAADAREASSSETRETREHLTLDRLEEKGAGDRDASQVVGVVDVTRLKFRASVVRDGKHPFGSVEASPRLGGAVWSVNQGWTVDLKVP